jgi:hypothetical protein
MSDNLNPAEPRSAPAESTALAQSFRLLRWVGYALLSLSLLDLLESMFPWELMNPAWEMQFMGALIDRSPVPLLGLVLAFIGEGQLRRRWESPVLLCLSWLALVLGLGFFLTLPLIIANTFRLERRAMAQIAATVKQQSEQADKAEAALSAASPQELDALLRRMGKAAEGKPPQQVRAEMTAEFIKARKNLQQQAGEARDNQRTGLIKRSAKLGAEALVVGLVLVAIWRSTAWARRERRYARA